jgi:hypothetical protein
MNRERTVEQERQQIHYEMNNALLTTIQREFRTRLKLQNGDILFSQLKHKYRDR